MIYPIGVSGQSIVLSDTALAHFARHRQLRWWTREAGGQLFARVSDDEIVIVEATGPRRTDRRSRHSYRSDPRAEQREIDERRPLDLHYVGDWHTHPEPLATPSPRDAESIGECVRKSSHSLAGFILIVVGQLPPPRGLYVAVHDGVDGYQLHSQTQGRVGLPRLVKAPSP